MRTYINILLFVAFSQTAFANAVYQYPSASPSFKTLLNSENLETIEVPFKITNPLDLSSIQTLFPNIIFNKYPQHSLTLTGTRPELAKLKHYLKNHPPIIKTIEYHLKILEVSTSNSSIKNIDIESMIKNTSPSKPFIISNETIQFLLKKGSASVISQPNIIINDKKTGTIKVGEKIPYITEHVFNNKTTYTLNQLYSGLTINLTPTILSKKKLQTDITLSFSNVKVWKQYNQNEYPVLTERDVQTSFTHNEKTPIVLAGLIQKETKQNNQQLTPFAHIPFIKKLFKNKNNASTISELAIIIEAQINTILL